MSLSKADRILVALFWSVAIGAFANRFQLLFCKCYEIINCTRLFEFVKPAGRYLNQKGRRHIFQQFFHVDDTIWPDEVVLLLHLFILLVLFHLFKCAKGEEPLRLRLVVCAINFKCAQVAATLKPDISQKTIEREKCL